MAICLDFDWQTNEFMLYCRTTQLREKTMLSYEQTLRLFEKWCMEEQGIATVDKVNENVIRRYIFDLQERGKYTFYANDKQKAINYPDRRRDLCFGASSQPNCTFFGNVAAERTAPKNPENLQFQSKFCTMFFLLFVFCYIIILLCEKIRNFLEGGQIQSCNRSTLLKCSISEKSSPELSQMMISPCS